MCVCGGEANRSLNIMSLLNDIATQNKRKKEKKLRELPQNALELLK